MHKVLKPVLRLFILLKNLFFKGGKFNIKSRQNQHGKEFNIAQNYKATLDDNQTEGASELDKNQNPYSLFKKILFFVSNPLKYKSLKSNPPRTDSSFRSWFKESPSYKIVPKVQSFFVRAWPAIKKRKTLIFIVLAAFFVADVLNIKSHNFILPEKQLTPIKQTVSRQQINGQNKYKEIWENNIFHRGEIPLKLVENKRNLFPQEPVKSLLSFVLKGTIVHVNPARSVATLKDLLGKTLSYKAGDTISEQVKVTEIQRGKIIFFNQNNNRLEFVTLPEDDKLNISYNQKKPISKSTESTLVRRNGNKFEVSRSDINNHLENIYKVLQQALVVPYRKNGEVEGYMFSQIEKGSIYEDLGFSKGDVIKSVNGESIKDPQKAVDMFQSLRTSSSLKILVERDGKELEYNYSVNENSAIN